MNKSIIQHIKSLVLMAVLALPVGTMLSSCSSDNDPFFTANEDDYPVILNPDLVTNEEWKNGEPPVLTTINRKENFVYEAIVTPAHYTTVTWFIDDVQVAEGKTIDYGPIPVGEHLLKIVATTTKGKETSRTRKISVTLCDDDPVAGKDIHDRLVKQGSVVQLHGKNISKVTKVIIGTQTVDATYNAGEDCVEYTVPDLPDGKYTLQLVDADGYVFDAGEIELNTNPVYPGVKETVLWEGSFDITWGTPFDGLREELVNHVEAGTILRVYVSGEGQGCAATKWWTNLVTGGSGDVGRGDTPISGDMVLDFPISELSIQLLKEQEGFLMVGNGYTLKKISVVTTAPAETTLWEGSYNVTWGTPFDGLREEMVNLVKSGDLLRAYVTGQGQGCAATKWWTNLVTGGSGDEGRGDTPISGDMVLEFPLSDLSIQLLKEQEGFLMVGNGYTLLKLTVE